MSHIVSGNGGPKRADLSLYVLPDRPGIKRARGPVLESSAHCLACAARHPARDYVCE